MADVVGGDDEADLPAVVSEIDRRLSRMPDDDPDRETAVRDRDRATLYLAAVRAGREELIPDPLYRELLERNAPVASDSTPDAAGPE